MVLKVKTPKNNLILGMQKHFLTILIKKHLMKH